LIVDEVLIGFGRTGRLFASEHFEIQPDILTTSKGLSSGYVPISAAIARTEIAELFDSPTRALQHAGTYSGHPVGCAAALANLEIIIREDLVRNAARQGERLREQLLRTKELPFVHSVNALGLLVGIDLSSADGRFDPAAVGPFIRDHAYANGLICRYAPTSIYLYPPLIVSAEQVDEIASILLAAFDAASMTFGCA
jgi:putrescine aminotransferase